MTYKTQLVWAVCAVIVLGAAIGARFYFLEKAEDRAFEMLSEVMAKYQVIRAENPENAFMQVEKDFQVIFDEYGKRDGGKLAKLMFANICYDSEKIDMAIKYYDAAINDFEENSFYYQLIINGLGYAYEKKEDYQSAVKYFEILSKNTENEMKAGALFNLGRIYTAMGETEKGLEAYRRIVSDHSESIYLDLAKEKLPG